ncbi:MAG: amino acid ABC transporter permease [Oscillospiraceae bacterium]|nr:amino acid ABC transporter permease [Oscillospiraceae bacterium]
MLTFQEKFVLNFIEDNRWRYLVEGLQNTIIITFFALIVGVVLGFTIALIRVTHDRTGKLKILNGIAKLYLTVIRGTPVLIQLMIMYYVVFAPFAGISKIVTAVMAFGINSGAYVAEIFRSGIMSVDNGQMEAGRSLGLNYNKTMWLIVMPQAIKNILPALGNEFITLLKETSVAGYIAIQDLTKGGDIIRSRTYEPFLPLLAVALIYLSVVLVLQAGVNKLERRLGKSDRR